MANTYGGIVLIGVAEDPDDSSRPQLPAVGVDPLDRERLVNQAYTRFQPPFAPDVVPVALPNGRIVLVVRIDVARAERPIVLTRKDDHKILVRLDARNATADRYRMAALFAEPPGAAAASTAVGNWMIGQQGPYPIDARSHSALLVRVAIEARIPGERVGHAVIDTLSRRELEAALREAPISRWLSAQMRKWANSWSVDEWRPLEAAYSDISTRTSRRWRAQFDTSTEAPVGAQASLILPMATFAFSGRLTLLLDASFDPQPLLKEIEDLTVPTRVRVRFRERLDLGDVFGLLLALLESALDMVAPSVFPRVLGVPAWETIGPVVYLHSPLSDAESRGLGTFINLDRYVVDRTTPNLDLQSATFVAPLALQLGSRDDRVRIVKEWLTRFLLDMGLENFENDVASL